MSRTRPGYISPPNQKLNQHHGKYWLYLHLTCADLNENTFAFRLLKIMGITKKVKNKMHYCNENLKGESA